MNRVIRNFGVLFLVGVMLLGMSACGSKTPDLPVSDISAAIDAVIADDGLASADDNYIEHYLGLDDEMYTECVVMLNVTGVNVNEYGVFKAEDSKKAKELGEGINSHLEIKKSTWMSEYFPEEEPKIKAADYKVFGNYVVYTILDEDTKANAYEAVEKLLK